MEKNEVVMTKIVQPAMLNVFAVWTFAENVCQTLIENLKSQRVSVPHEPLIIPLG